MVIWCSKIWTLSHQGSAILLWAASMPAAAQPPAAPVGPEFWTSSTNPATAPIKALYGTRPFFLTSEDQFRPPPPPAFGSPAFLADLAEIRQLSDTRTPEQLAQAQFWAAKAAPYLNEVAVDLIRTHHRTEREAAHILAYANMAAFDAMIACSPEKWRRSALCGAILFPN